MSGWGTFWYIVLTTALVSYFGLAVVISIGGFFDVKKMFKRLSASAVPEATPGAPPPDAGTDAREER